MPHATIDNIRFFYEEAGSGPPVVFLHGFTLDHRMWQPQIEYFKERFRVICPDARGHGKSDAPLTGYSRAHRVEDLAGLVDRLGFERFHLVGLSMGGAGTA
jgi:3-oxoadipate enol-lactonase